MGFSVKCYLPIFFSVYCFIIYMEKLLSSDWLRQMQFSGNSVQKRVNSVQKRVNSVQRK